MRISLRKLRDTDWKYILRWWRDEELIRLTSGVREDSPRVLRGYFEALLKSKKDHHFIILSDKRPIGHVSLSDRKRGVAEIHIIIGEGKYRGKGLGTLAIKKASEIAFGKLGYQSLVLEVRPDNVRAIGAYLNCGFTKRGMKRYPGTSQPVVLVMRLKR